MRQREQFAQGLNVHIHPSSITSASRLERFSLSLQETGCFAETHIVGTTGPGLDNEQLLDANRRIIRLQAFRQRGSFIGKAIRGFSWYPKVYWKYRNAPISAVQAHTVFALPVSFALSRRARAILVYNPHELETGVPAMMGLKRWIATVIERRLVERSHVMTVVNESIADWYRENYPKADPIVVRNIPLRAPAPRGVREAVGAPDDDLLFVHTGRLGEGRNIPSILAVFQALPPHVNKSVVFVGHGGLEREVRHVASQSPHVFWHPPVPPDQVVEFIRSADVAFCLIDTSSLSYRYSSPNKLFEALSAGLPVISTPLVEVQRIQGGQASAWQVRDPRQDLARVIRQIDHEHLSSVKHERIGVLPPWEQEISDFLAAITSNLRRAA